MQKLPPSNNRLFQKRQAFTLIELLVTLGVILILGSLISAAIGPSMRASDNAKCVSHLREIGAAMMLYTADHDGTLPGPVYAEQSPFYRANADGVVSEGHLISHLVPYLNEVTPPPGASNARNAKVFLCPAWVKFRSKQGYVTPGTTITGVPFQANTRYLGYYGTTSTPASAPKKLAAVENPTKERVFFETDAKDGTPYGNTGNFRLATEPVHQTHRNHLYFDGHVTGVSKEL